MRLAKSSNSWPVNRLPPLAPRTSPIGHREIVNSKRLRTNAIHCRMTFINSAYTLHKLAQVVLTFFTLFRQQHLSRSPVQPAVISRSVTSYSAQSNTASIRPRSVEAVSFSDRPNRLKISILAAIYQHQHKVTIRLPGTGIRMLTCSPTFTTWVPSWRDARQCKHQHIP